MDRTALLARFLDDEELLNDMVTRLLARVPLDLDGMRAASAAHDIGAVHRLAHTLKGSLGMFGPSPAYDAASRLESVSRGEEMNAVVRELDTLDTTLGHLTAELRRLVPPVTDPS